MAMSSSSDLRASKLRRRHAWRLAFASTLFGLAVLGRTGFSRESLRGIVEGTLDGLRP